MYVVLYQLITSILKKFTHH